ncbi:netrin-4-like [Ornithorhynchus anatinus]|uniref:netrin-4-like n=1 Tax=Ornithorhynchus anatinus TaxID=9258 RepID=UPI0019D48908|nr:netrin-4-like [Ornithorhynchus anatinus]
MPPTLPHASVGKRDEGPRRLDASRTVLAPGGSPGLAAMQPRSLTLLVFLEYIVTRHGEADPGRLAPFSCDGHACNPPVANLATGRTPVTLTTCGQNATELYCSYLHEPAPLPTLPGCGQPRCTKCNAQQPDNAHPPPDMTDDFFVHPGTWWQSAQGVHREEIQLDLETEFYLTHVIVVFKSPQPAATILERSQDHGQTWRPYKYFAINCTAAFGLQDDLTDEGSTCTSRYSDAVPCTRGEVSSPSKETGTCTFLSLPSQRPRSCFNAGSSFGREDSFTMSGFKLICILRLAICCLEQVCIGMEDKVAGIQKSGVEDKEVCFLLLRLLSLRPYLFHLLPQGYLPALTPASRIEDPYGPEALDLLKLTNLRLLLLKRQDCPCQAGRLLEKPQRFTHYAIYDLIVRGSCFCNGHAEECQLANGTGGSENVVHGKCLCSHNTAGQHCERCAPLYNDQPWKPGDGKTGEPNECKKCHCHDHSGSCHFDLGIWLGSGKRSGSVCDGCKHNTEGHRCQRCKPGFYRDRSKPMSSPEACKPCSCQSLGLANGMLHRTWRCHPKTGYCFCKPGVAGPNCDRCLMGYWGFGKSGCYPCNCSRDCDPHTGECVTGYEKEPIFHVPIGGQISDLIQMPENERKEQWKWNGHEQGFSALRHPEKCVCKEKVLGSVNDFCQMKFAYVIKARIVSAHDKGTHAEVVVKVKKILKSGKVKISRNNRSIYPESWMNRGCTCPILNPGTDYLVAGQEDTRSGKLLVNMNSLVKPWKAFLGKQVAHILRTGCK